MALRLLYATYYAGLACFGPFLPIFYRSHGLSGVQIGVLAAVSPAVALSLQPVWGGWADRRGERRTVLLTVILGSGTACLLFLLAGGFLGFMLCAAAMAAFSTSIAPLADSLTLVHLGAARERYARVRLWGAAGFALATAAMGAWLRMHPLREIFIVYPAAIGIAAALALRAPSGRTPAARLRGVWSALPELARTPDYRAFVGIACILQLATSANGAFLSVYLHAMGSSTAVVGLAWAVAACTEVPVMACAPALAARWGPRRVLIVAMLAYVARYALFAVLARRGPVWILLLQATQGIPFGLYYTTAVPYVSRLAPPHMQTSGQAVFAAATQGATAILATVLAGVIFDRLGPNGLYEAAAVAAAVAAAAMLLARLPERPADRAVAQAGEASAYGRRQPAAPHDAAT